MRIAITLFLLLLSLVNAQDKCSAYLNCTSCINDSACGWCTSLRKCLLGDPSGPFGPSNDTKAPNCHWWRYGPGSCQDQDECLPFTDCVNCTQQPSCGWCGFNCLVGNSSGPYDQHSFCPSWSWSLDNCSSLDCQNFKSCSACTLQKMPFNPNKQGGCGWCQITSNCSEGSSAGPSTYGCATWHWISPSCGNIGNTCSYADCHSCISDPSGLCGWCDTKKSCMPIPQQGSANCPDFRVGTCQDSCNAHSFSCDVCQRTPGCGFCGDFCTLGNQSGPTYFPRQYCSPWTYDQNTCDLNRCQSFGTCDECSLNGCFWCPQVGCQTQFNLSCCLNCFNCLSPLTPGSRGVFEHITVALFVGCGTVIASLLIATILYTFWKYYWTRRHYFETLK